MEHTLGLMVIHILEIGSMTNNMVMAFISSQMEPGIKANFMKVNLLEKEFWEISQKKMTIFYSILDYGQIQCLMEKEKQRIRTEIDMMENFREEKE